MEILGISLGRHEQLLQFEIEAISSLYQENIDWKECNSISTDKKNRFYYIGVKNETVARQVFQQSVLFTGCYQIISNGDCLDTLIKSLIYQFGESTTEYREQLKVYGQRCTLSVVEFKKRLRSPVERDRLLSPLSKVNLANVINKYSSKQCPNNQQHPTHFNLFIHQKQHIFCRRITQSLSPSSGGKGGRSGGGILKNYVLYKRPFVGFTAMDPELSFIMTNLAKVSKGKLVWDPFAGSCGILLACSFFKCQTFASDLSIRQLTGDGPKRNIEENFLKLKHDIPERFQMNINHINIRLYPIFDAIICDPPYGIRTFGEVNETNLLYLSSKLLIPGGRLVFWTYLEKDRHIDTLQDDVIQDLMKLGNTLKLISLTRHTVSYHENNEWSRCLIVIEAILSKDIQRSIIPISCRECTSAKTQDIHPMRFESWVLSRSLCPNLSLDIWRASWLGDVISIQGFVESGGDVNRCDEQGNSPLYYACGYNQSLVIQYLLDHGASPDILCLHQACRQGHVEAIDLLLKNKMDGCLLNYSSDGTFASYWAATYGHISILEIIYKYNIQSMLLETPAKINCLIRAAECGKVKAVEIIIKLVPELIFKTDFYGRTAFQWACRNNHIKVLKCFNMKIMMLLLKHQDLRGDTPLHEAVYYNRYETVQYILSNENIDCSSIFHIENLDKKKAYQCTKNNLILSLFQDVL